MEGFWKNALKVGGPVTIVAFVLWGAIRAVFEQKVLDIFGNEQIFIIVLVILSGLFICLFAAILTFRKNSNGLSKNTGNKAVFKNSSVKGDVVLGDKNIRSGNNDD